MRRKVLIISILLIFVLLLFTSTVLAAGISETTINLQEDNYVKLVEGRTIIPIEILANYLDFKVTYYPDNNNINISLDKKEIVIQSGTKEIVVDGNTINIDTAPQVLDNRIYVPIRALAENLGYQVDWYGTNNIVIKKAQ